MTELPKRGNELVNKAGGLYVRQYGSDYPDGYKDYEVLRVYESFTGWYWFVTEAEPVADDIIYFGYVQGNFCEWGSFSRNELRSLGSKIWEVPRKAWEYTGRRGLQV